MASSNEDCGEQDTSGVQIIPAVLSPGGTPYSVSHSERAPTPSVRHVDVSEPRRWRSGTRAFDRGLGES
jgi:hypothetical protein